ncbi:glycosyltransferase family 4 protein [Paraburkholderia phosphatilytica]|uniref:glycosyltransferase family 4 protein n=1 Tax=Paraburkholderia phosphatilytica TaxID=2282883 RepID=UPI000E48BE37|nr:glycosyltransferase family 4 protein [Paraburkholderia phosphatilytica]
MKIGLSCNALKYSGGLERYAMDLVRGLVARGHRPAVFARRFDPSLPESRMVDAHRINVSFLPGKLRDMWFSWRLAAARRAQRVDVLIGCNRVVGSEIAICGGTHRGFLRAMGRKPKQSDLRQIELEARQYETSRVVVAHSQLMHDELRELYDVPEDKIRVLYPPVDGTRFAPADAAARVALRERFGFGENEIVLLFPSSSHERKGLPLIEAALATIDLPVVVAVAGRAPDRTSQRVRYVGYVKDIEDCYRAADFTILASLYEPFGLVGIESVMCGTPVIFASNIGCCDAIDPSMRHTFAPGDAAGLRAAVERAIAASSERSSDSNAAHHPNPVRYDAGIDGHVDALLALASQIAR